MNWLEHMLIRMRDRGLTPNGFIDAGAHFGETANVIHRVFPDKRVVSFEANPECEDMLKSANIEYIICLLGDKTVENVPFFVNPDDPTSTGNSIYQEKSKFFEAGAFTGLPMYRLDEIVPVEAKLDFLKMDVQGAEINILRGATKLLPTIKWIYLEVSFVSLNKDSPLFGEVFDYLRENGYRIADLCDPTWIENELVQCNFLFERIPVVQQPAQPALRIETHRHSPQMGHYQSGLNTDGLDYHILYDAAQRIKGVDGLTCELGIREGGSSAMIIQACLDNNDKRIHVGVDPYGNIEFLHPHADGTEGKIRSDWTNDMKQRSMPKLYQFCLDHKVEFQFFCLECTEFFKRYADGIPIYNEYKQMANKYALVFFDAPPSPDGMTKYVEAEFFQSRTPVGGIFVFDDVKIYNHDVVHQKLINDWGFELMDSGWKSSYRKVRKPVA